MTGSVDAKANLKLLLSFKNRETIQTNGEVKTENKIISFESKADGSKLEILLDLDYWFATSDMDGKTHKIPLFLKVVGNQATGLSNDTVGFAVWRAEIGSQFYARKQYLQQYEAEYSGKLGRRGESIQARGFWSAGDNKGSFYVSYKVPQDN